MDSSLVHWWYWWLH